MKKYTWNVSDTSETGLKVVSNLDPNTGFLLETIEFNASVPYTASILAYGGAKISRQNTSFTDLLREIQSMSKKNASEAIGGIVGYGHASVAEMSPIMVVMNNIPDSIATRFFANTSVGAGQQSSTRFIDFSGGSIVNLSTYLDGLDVRKLNGYTALNKQLRGYQNMSLGFFRKWRDRLLNEYKTYFRIGETLPGDNPKWSDKARESALTARVLDTARVFLPFGLYNKTTAFWITNAREWAIIISTLRSSSNPKEVMLGNQIFSLLSPNQEILESLDYTPEAAHLIRYANKDETTSANLESLSQWVKVNLDLLQSGEKYTDSNSTEIKLDARFLNYDCDVRTIALYILTVRPEWNYEWICSTINQLEIDKQRQLSDLLFGSYDCYSQIPDRYTTDGFGFDVEASLSEYRDLNRHRAWSRFSPLVMSEWDNLPTYSSYGFILPLYLTEISEFSSIHNELWDNLMSLEESRYQLLSNGYSQSWFPKNLALETVLFSTNAKFVMSGGVKQFSYMTDRRERPGGHINYRRIAWEMADQMSSKIPLLSGLKLSRDGVRVEKPDPSSRTDFLDRS